jgi:hypothetical protein
MEYELVFTSRSVYGFIATYVRFEHDPPLKSQPKAAFNDDNQSPIGVNQSTTNENGTSSHATERGLVIPASVRSAMAALFALK